jgi:putative ABC transport system permease protein
VLEPTHTANDRVLFIPLISFYAISEHEDAMATISAIRGGGSADTPAPAPPPKSASKPLDEFLKGTDAPTTSHAHDDHDHDGDGKADHKAEDHPDTASTEASHDGHDHDHGHRFELNPDGTINLELPKSEWMVSAILVQSRGPFLASSLMYQINNGVDAQAVNPATVMREFFGNFLEPGTKLWLLVAILVTLVASVSILVSIYNAVVARLREIAILRALGATRRRILAQICLEAGLIGLTGAVVGLILGHLLAAAGSAYMQRLMGEGLNWTRIGREETLYLLAVTVIAVIAGLVPATKAYRTPVATNLVAA